MTTPPANEPPARDVSDQAPSIRRVIEIIQNILRLERTVGRLEKENRALSERVETMQRQLDEQTGQVAVLRVFVERALDDKVASRAEAAALQALERFFATMETGRRSGPWRDDELK